MEKRKTSLVLEGGGMRGAFTAGALAWLLDNNIEFDNAYGISTGAVHLCSFLLKNRDYLESFSTVHIASKRAVGAYAFLNCGHVVDYDYLFKDLMPKTLKFSLKPLKDLKCDAYIGTYELEKGKTEYNSVRTLSMAELQAACTLPILGKKTKYKGRTLLDGGITDMIPIEQAIKDGCNRNLVISTKPITYVRKPAKAAIVNLMKITYPECPQISEDYRIRHINFTKQITDIKNEEADGKALYIYPTLKTKVSRLGGSHEELMALFNHGYATLERRKEEVYQLLGIHD